MFSRLFDRSAAPDDPLVVRLKDLPIPLSAAGTFVEGLKTDREKLYRARGTDNERKSGFVANYRLHWRRSWDAIQTHIARDNTPILESVEQLITVLKDDESATWWFLTQTERVKHADGCDIGGQRYGQLTFAPLADLGDEANLGLVPKTQLMHGGITFHETALNIRVGRLVATVRTTAALGDTRTERQVQALAASLARRMSDALRIA
jgi:hypothetical protein